MGLIKFVSAQHSDLPFILDAIIESEKAGSNFVTYCTLFNISESELRKTILQLFDDEIEHTAWYLPYWTIGTVQNKPICAMSSWIEKSGLGADATKLQAMHYYLKDKVEPKYLSNQLRKLKKVSIVRNSDFLQLEHLYTDPHHRGKGYIKKLIHHVISENMVSTAQIQLTANNKQALKAYLDCGFSIDQTKCFSGMVTSKLLSDDCKISLTRSI